MSYLIDILFWGLVYYFSTIHIAIAVGFLTLWMIGSWGTFFPGRFLRELRDKKESASKEETPSIFRKLISEEGVALTDLRPIGKVDVNNEIFEAKSLQGYISKGIVVRIVDTKSNVIIVESVN